MTKIVTCLLDGKVVTVDRAAKLMSSRARFDFRCPECFTRVRFHRVGGHMPAHFEHLKRNPSCSLSVPKRIRPESGRGKLPWTEEELRASVAAYISVLHQSRSGKPAIKKQVYADLAGKFGRSPKSFEYRMQNISYVLSLMGRGWLPGLQPARNVGPNIASKIEALVAEIEGRAISPAVAFEIEANGSRSQKSVPGGNRRPATTNATVTQYARDPNVKGWVIAEAKGVCECCGSPAPFSRADGPFLELHHVHHLADGGSDTVSNAVAICPNCHRRLHYSLDAVDVAETLYSKISRLVREG